MIVVYMLYKHVSTNTEKNRNDGAYALVYRR